MFQKIASAPFGLIALIGFVMTIVFMGWTATRLSGSDRPLLVARSPEAAPTASSKGSVPGVIPPHDQDGMDFMGRHFLDRMQFSESDEISSYWRIRSQNKFGLDKYSKAFSEPPNTPMMVPLDIDYIYCPAWFNRRQLRPTQDNLSPPRLLEPALIYIRNLGERIGFYEGSCKLNRARDKGLGINRICLYYPELEQTLLFNEFITAQEHARLRAKMKFSEVEPPVCWFGLDYSRCCSNPDNYEDDNDQDFEQMSSEYWFDNFTCTF
jgi:hypothetical protein